LAIGSTGRLCAQKDIATLIYGVAHLRKIQPDLKFLLLLAGHGPDLSKLRALTDELHMAEYIKFLGFLREIPNFLAALDIFISSSLKEGMSISILEAMAARKPIITTAIPPNAELIEDMVTGLLIPVKSPESVARSILKFVYKPDLAQKCAIEARAQVLKKYTINRMFHETWELYNNLLNCKNAPISSSDLA
jgi:glycosyltransferase involved in cell wall biosynthesis